MPIFAKVYESIVDFHLLQDAVTDELNNILTNLQEKGAKIRDIKVSMSNPETYTNRTYLIIYEAEKPVEFK